MVTKFILRIKDKLTLHKMTTIIFYMLNVIFIGLLVWMQLNFSNIFYALIIGFILSLVYHNKINRYIDWILLLCLIGFLHLYLTHIDYRFLHYILIIIFLPSILSLTLKPLAIILMSYISLLSIFFHVDFNHLEVINQLTIILVVFFTIIINLLIIFWRIDHFHSKRSVEKLSQNVQDLSDLVHFQHHYDGLTGLMNKSSMENCLKQAIIKYKNQDQLFVFIILNLDRLRVINSSYGIEVGDMVIKEISDRLKSTKLLSISRIRGDEFAILIEDTTKLATTLLAKEILNLCHTPMKIMEHEIILSASLGIVFSDERFDLPQEYFRCAEISMFEAKYNGKNTYEIFNQDLDKLTSRQLQLENDLKEVLIKNELKIYYQPIVSLKTQEVVSFEALIRWIHPKFGLISPVEFIKIAEDTGLIITIGEWVFYEVCKKIIQLESKYAISFNLSPIQFKYHDLIKHFKKITEELGVNPNLIHIEITETAFIDNITLAKEVLDQFKNLGFKIHLDDFGTGYSSLSYLCTLPIDTVKIDRSFIQSINESEKNYNLVNSILYMSFSLQMSVIGEGIETTEQHQILKDLGCTYGQGYLFSKPLSEDELTLLELK